MILKPIHKSIKYNLICFIEKNNNQCKLYIKKDIPDTPNLYILAQYQNSHILTKQLIKETDMLYCELPEHFDCSEDICICIGSFYSEDISLLAKGSTNDSKNFDTKLAQEKDYLLDELRSIFHSEFAMHKQEKSKVNDVKSCSSKCDDCFYKKYYMQNTQKDQSNISFEQPIQSTLSTQNFINPTKSKESEESTPKVINLDQSESTSSPDSQSTEQSSKDVSDFFSQIQSSIQTLFNSKPKDYLLENSIEQSKFVKINYENTDDYYSVGVIYENQEPRYICYALPCTSGSPPPENMKDFSQYLPINQNKGYYLMYQDAKTGENIVIETI